MYCSDKKNNGGQNKEHKNTLTVFARGIIYSMAEFSGHVELRNHWAYSSLKRMNLVLRKATTTTLRLQLFTRTKFSDFCYMLI